MPGTTDTVKAMLTPGEFVIRKEAVDMIGVPILEKLNDMPEAGGHSEIDRLIAMATLKNMTGMYGGGMVNAKQYMGGGMVNEYKHGGKVHKNLKPIPKDNPGLAKLPEAVRNKMGYMQDGGEVSPEMLLDLAKIRNLNYTQPSFRFPIMESLNNLDLSDVYMDSVRSGGNTEIFDRLRSLASSFGQKNDSSKERYKPLSDEEILDFYNQLKKSSIMESREDGGLLGMMKGGMAKKKKKYGYQEGGAVQDSSMMMQPSPFIPFDQRPNQSPASGNWGEFGAYYNALKNNLQAEREELVADTARNALDSLKLDSLIKQMSGDAMRIERSPSEPFFFPNTPVQENFMQKYKEEMIDPTYFPEGN